MSSTTLPLTAAAAADLGVSAVLESLAALERARAAIDAMRAVAVDELRRIVTTTVPTPSASAGLGTDESALASAARRETATEVACALRVSESAALALVDESRSLVHELPATLEALREGSLGYEHARAIVDEARDLPASAHASFEAQLVPEAAERTAAGLRQKARRLRETLHPESIERRHREARERRDVRLEPARDGMAWLSAYLPAEHAIAAHDRLTRIAQGLGTPENVRTLAQRRADAFVDLLVDGEVASTRLGRGVRASVLVTVPVLTLLGHDSSSFSRATPDGAATGPVAAVAPSIEGYGPISPETARRLAAHAPSFTRILTHPETGTVLSVGRDRYTVPRDLKLWLRVRDGTCRFPGCGRSAATSDVDHTVDWQLGGATRHDNLAHLCEGHHLLKHRGRWSVEQKDHGTLEWRAPSGLRYRTSPEVTLSG